MLINNLKDYSLFWVIHFCLIVSEAALVAHNPRGSIYVAQIVVLSISSFWYVLLLLSYVDIDTLIIEKDIHVSVHETNSGLDYTGRIVEYYQNVNIKNKDEILIKIDDLDEKKIHVENSIKIIHPSRGFVVQALNTFYEKCIKNAATNTTTNHTINLHSELNMLSIEYESGKEENRLERYCIIFGWVLIATGYYGIAALRAFRVFRILWYYNIKVLKPYLNFNFETVLFAGEKLDNYESTLFTAMKLMVQNLESLGKEMFTITGRGGLLLMLIFFYSAFVFGAAYWIETGDDNFGNGIDKFGNVIIIENYCKTLSSCVYTMMRLTFYDGNGFDYAQNIMHTHRELFVLLIIYLCITAFGMLNGLIGIFGDSFLRNITATGSSDSTMGGMKSGPVDYISLESKLHDILNILTYQDNKINELSAVVTKLLNDDEEEENNNNTLNDEEDEEDLNKTY